jgi:anti-sigma-K factor RskA
MNLRERKHVERMLGRARRRAKQAAKLVEKWEKRLAAMDRLEVDAKQPKLWEDSEPEVETQCA